MTDAERLADAAPVCFVPCHYGGMSAARKYSGTPLGYAWRCNRRVRAWGLRCYQHAGEVLDATEQARLEHYSAAYDVLLAEL